MTDSGGAGGTQPACYASCAAEQTPITFILGLGPECVTKTGGACDATCEAEFASSACLSNACALVCAPNARVCAGKCVDTGTDPEHCGECGTLCSGTCLAGACETKSADVLATLGAPPAGYIRQDATHLYWISGTDILRIAKSGGAVETIETAQTGIGDIAVQQDKVYWSVSTAHEIRVAPVTGGTPEVFYSGNVVPTVGTEGLLAVTSQYLYWQNGGALDASPGNPVVRKPLGGGSPETVAETDDVSGGVHTAYAIENLLADDRYVYWNRDSAGSSAYRAPTSGGVAQALGGARLAQAAQNSSAVYFTDIPHNPDFFSLARLSKSTGAYDPTATFPDATLPDVDRQPRHMTANERSVYFDASSKGILRMNVCSLRFTLLEGKIATGSFVADEDYLYWVEFPSLALRKTPESK